MTIKKFIAPTARQALNEIRSELGDGAVILSNRKVDEGVEILALANEGLLSEIRDQASGVRHQESGLSKRAGNKSAQITAPNLIPEAESSVLGEIKSMHSMLQQQFAALSWMDVQQRDPQRAGLLRRMLNSGFSAQLARQMLDKMPAWKAQGGTTQGDAWVKQVLQHNLRVAGAADDIVAKGGVYALIGPTGVGKTTTTAKLAARAVVRYGADKVVLLTTDSYRIGAYEQLKIYGKILGVAVHAIKDGHDLNLTLSTLRHKHLVLIDSIGMGQRDERVDEQNEMFDNAQVQCLLLLNAASNGSTLDDVVCMYQKPGRNTQQGASRLTGCILTKLDEAVSPGAALDVAMRHRLVMHYMTNGQRVPEDLHPINLNYLMHRALKPTEEKTPFTLNELEFTQMMAAEGSPHSHVKGVSAGVLLAGSTGKEASYAL